MHKSSAPPNYTAPLHNPSPQTHSTTPLHLRAPLLHKPTHTASFHLPTPQYSTAPLHSPTPQPHFTMPCSSTSHTTCKPSFDDSSTASCVRSRFVRHMAPSLLCHRHCDHSHCGHLSCGDEGVAIGLSCSFWCVPGPADKAVGNGRRPNESIAACCVRLVNTEQQPGRSPGAMWKAVSTPSLTFHSAEKWAYHWYSGAASGNERNLSSSIPSPLPVRPLALRNNGSAHCYPFLSVHRPLVRCDGGSRTYETACDSRGACRPGPRDLQHFNVSCPTPTDI